MHKGQTTQKQPTNNQFSGFTHPSQNWFRLPNNWTDITSEITSLAELKVVEYVLKHTWGYQEYGLTKTITTDEFMHGRQRKNRSRMDKGTGLSKPSVIEGLKKAVAQGFLVETIDASDRARIKKSYALKMLNLQGGDNEPVTNDEPICADVKNLYTGVKKLHPDVKNLHTSYEESLHRSEKDTLERNFIKPLNGDESIFKKLPILDQPKDKSEYIAQYIMDELQDTHSTPFYKLIATRIPEDVIRQTLAEIRADGADSPPKLFTFKMNRYALKKLKEAA